MPTQSLISPGRVLQDAEMPGLDLVGPAWTTAARDHPHFRKHKQLPRRRDPPFPSTDLQMHYRTTTDHVSHGLRSRRRGAANITSQQPFDSIVKETVHTNREVSSDGQVSINQPRATTPIHQKSPPTPDMTPPRHANLLRPRQFLAEAPSVSSRAESFKTAKEDLSSDDDVESHTPIHRNSNQRWIPLAQVQEAHNWAVPINDLALAREDTTPKTPTRPSPKISTATFLSMDEESGHGARDVEGNTRPEVSESYPLSELGYDEPLRSVPSHPSPLPTPPAEQEAPPITPEPQLQRGKSLRDRVEESRIVRSTDSTEQFALDIGWSHVYGSAEMKNRMKSWRISGVSTTSTVEAIVVDTETTPQRQKRLRHSRKNHSLRSTSSPLPSSNRDSVISNPESPHRLVHKRGQITNKTRSRMGSDASKSQPMPIMLAEAPQLEVIRVAVIPTRKSSLQSSADNSRRHSLSSSSFGLGSVETSVAGNSAPPYLKKRSMSANLPGDHTFGHRGRNRHYPPTVPPRGSSLSAPTSRSTSRANSLTSEHLRSRRLAAEEDVHRTLERMESERSAPLPKASPLSRRESGVQSEVGQWGTLSPPLQHTPFSLPSTYSPSPGPVETGEARAINLFPHNNKSLQLIDQQPQSDTHIAGSLQMPGAPARLMTETPSTPTMIGLPLLQVDSPLRHPRDPPLPPDVKVIPPTPANMTPIESPLVPESPRKGGTLRTRFGSLQRPAMGLRQRSESFAKTLGRSLSLRSSRNVKVRQNLDANLHPFWRPRGFWDDFGDSDSEYEEDRDDHHERAMDNSIGISQKDTIIDGPVSLMRALSDRSHRGVRSHGVRKSSSHGSLSRLRAGRQLYRIPRLNLHLPGITFRDFQNRLQLSKWRSDDVRRERRRQVIRERIGPQVVSTGDSRYPPPYQHVGEAR